MAKKQINFIVDTMQQSYSTIGTFKQLDSVYCIIQITEQGVAKDLTGQTLKLYINKPDKTVVEQKTGINIVSAVEGKITIDLLNSALQAEGFAVGELNINDASGSISTVNFNFRVTATIANNNFIQSTNEIETLKEVELYVVQAKKEIQDFKKLQEQMLNTNKNINTQEAGRVTAEKDRVAAEENRAETYEKINANYLAISQEITDARGQSESLKEEQDRRDKNILDNMNVSYIPYEGQAIKADNCFNGKTQDMLIEGKTLQNLYTSEHVIDGKVTMTANGKWVARGMQTDLKMLKPNTKYTLICFVYKNSIINIDSDRTVYINVQATDRVFRENMLIPNNATGIFTSVLTTRELTEEVIYGVYPSISPRATGGDIEFSIILLEGESTQIPKEYFEGIQSVGQEGDKISILSCGKNLFKEKWLKGSVTDTNGSLTSWSNFCRTEFIPIKKGQYVVTIPPDFDNSTNGDRSTRIVTYDINKNFIKKNSAKFIIEQDGYLIFSCKFRPDGNILTDEEIKNIKGGQLESGTTQTSYEAYRQDKKDILLPFSEGLKGLPNGISDESYENGDFLQKIGICDYSSYDNWGWDASASNEEYILFSLQDSSLPLGFYSDGFCNNFNVKNIYSGTIFEEGVYISKGPRCKIKRSRLETQDVEGFKKWLKANPTFVYYQLETPILHKAEKPTNINLNTYKPITHLSSEPGPVNPILKCKIPSDAPAVISDLKENSVALENENKNLKNEIQKQALYFHSKDLDLMTNALDQDFRILDIEIIVGIDNLNLKNERNVKNMSQYEMMKTLILAGRYERIDMEAKVDKYLKYNKITQEQADELIALMDAREIIQK